MLWWITPVSSLQWSRSRSANSLPWTHETWSLTNNYHKLGEWVKGHYTGKHWRFQHEKADSLGTHCLKHQKSPHHTIIHARYPYQITKFHLLLNGSVTTSRYSSLLSMARHEQGLLNYIKRKAKQTDIEFNKVHWNAHEHVFKCLTRHTAKWIHSPANTNRQTFLYCKTTNLCPGCQETEDTIEHVPVVPIPRPLNTEKPNYSFYKKL